MKMRSFRHIAQFFVTVILRFWEPWANSSIRSVPLAPSDFCQALLEQLLSAFLLFGRTIPKMMTMTLLLAAA